MAAMRGVLTMTMAAWSGLSACAPQTPPHWAQGGAPLVIAAARWDLGDETVQILPNGQVVRDGDVLFAVDRVGRVVDEDNDPVALLLPDGRLAGSDGMLGHVGLNNASPPGASTAWLSLLPNGQVLFFDRDGDREPQGVWRGCQGPVRRTCTLVTHVLALQRESRRSSGPAIGVGLGVGF
ncbi:MAG: hypothetical protein JW940_39660 [Polyangiaceae bacterium]|nr:hypothetical protein [Polyangiaceae bacterium]